MHRVIILLLLLLALNSVEHLAGRGRSLVVFVDDISPSYPLSEHYALFDIFDRYGIKPMLFIIPDHAGQHPLSEDAEWAALIRQKISEGYSVGIHGYTHSHWEFFNLTRPQVDEKLALGQAEFEQALGTKPQIFRAPAMAILPRVHDYVVATGLKDASKTIGHEYTWYASDLGNKISLFQNSLQDAPYVLVLHIHAANTPEGLAFLDYALSYLHNSRQMALGEYLDKYDKSMDDYLRRYELESNRSST